MQVVEARMISPRASVVTIARSMGVRMPMDRAWLYVGGIDGAAGRTVRFRCRGEQHGRECGVVQLLRGEVLTGDGFVEPFWAGQCQTCQNVMWGGSPSLSDEHCNVEELDGRTAARLAKKLDQWRSHGGCGILYIDGRVLTELGITGGSKAAR